PSSLARTQDHRRHWPKVAPGGGAGLGAVIQLLERRVPLAGTIANPVSMFPVTVDGQFTNGLGAGEWSDVTPASFHSPLTPGDTFRPTMPGDPTTNSLLYAALAPEMPPPTGTPPMPGEDLYLMYDYAPRTIPTFQPGEFIADITFPVTIGDQEKIITVQFRGKQQGAPGGTTAG